MGFNDFQISIKQTIYRSCFIASFIAFSAPSSFAENVNHTSNSIIESVSVGRKKEKKAKKKNKSKKGKGPSCGAYG